jgi:phospholipase/carboxylesterase
MGQEGRDGLLYVPETYDGSRPVPLMVVLHGGGGNPFRSFNWVFAASDRMGFIALFPQSLGRSWDLIRNGSFGEDAALIDGLLHVVFTHYHVDPDLLALAGHSDGASYALSLGLTNGDLFSAILAFSPGFLDPGSLNGKPRVLISHGTEDKVLPVDRSRMMVQLLANTGYEVHYAEFDGGHGLPSEIADLALRWLTGQPPEPDGGQTPAS